MTNVLIIGYFWPYHYGSKRIIGLASYLSEFGWQPIILTAPLHGKPAPRFRVIETPCRDALRFWKTVFGFNSDENIGKQVKRRLGITRQKSLIDFFLTRLGEVINYPDSERGWIPFALKAAHQLLQEQNIGAVVSVWPITSHLIAKELRIKHKIPWLADFPDLWSQNHNYGYSPLRKLLDRRLEVKTLSRADALVTVSEPWAEKLRVLHKGKLVYSITHGFDPAEVNMPPAELTGKFTITYTGTIYTGKEDPAKLFAALKDLIAESAINPDDIEVRFYGTGVGWLDEEIEQYGLSNIVKHYGRVPKEKSLEKQRESQLLLLLRWEDSQERGWYSGKLLEYLGARRPILATGGSDDVISELLDETEAGICAPTAEDVKNALKEFYREYKLKGGIAFKGNISKLNKYSHREMARKFADILDQLILNKQRTY